MQSVEAVIHAAALKRIEVGHYNPDEMVKTNVIGSMNVMEAARRAGVSKVLLVSSDKAFEPVSPYGQSKALAESLFLHRRTSRTTGRASRWCATATSPARPARSSHVARGDQRRRAVKPHGPGLHALLDDAGRRPRAGGEHAASMKGGEVADPRAARFPARAIWPRRCSTATHPSFR
jgi:hypothetical protein